MILIAGVLIIVSCDNNVPSKRSEIASTLYKDKMYVAGGISFWGSSNRFESYDIVNDKWTRLSNLPNKLNHVGLSSFQGQIYLSGGYYNARQTKLSNVMHVYDIESGNWCEVLQMPEERASHFMIERDEYLHLVGGSNHVDILSFNLISREWKKDMMEPLPEKRDHLSLLQTEHNLYVVGGRQHGVVKADCWKYSLEENKWSVITSLPTPRGGQSSCLFKNQIHVIGGEDLHKGFTFKRHDVFDLATMQWSEGEPLQIARHGFVSELVDSTWYIYGGGKMSGFKTLISTTSNLETISL